MSVGPSGAYAGDTLGSRPQSRRQGQAGGKFPLACSPGAVPAGWAPARSGGPQAAWQPQGAGQGLPAQLPPPRLQNPVCSSRQTGQGAVGSLWRFVGTLELLGSCSPGWRWPCQLLPVPRQSGWSQNPCGGLGGCSCLHGQAGRALARVVARMSLCLLLLTASLHLVTLGGHTLAQALLCSSGTVGLTSWKDTKPHPPDLGSTNSAGLRDLGLGGRTCPRVPCAGSQGGLVPPAYSWPPLLPAGFPGGPSQSLELLSGMFTHKHFNVAGRFSGALGTEKTPLWLCQVSCRQPPGPSNPSHLGPSDPGGPPCQVRWTHAPPEGYSEGMTH